MKHIISRRLVACLVLFVSIFTPVATHAQAGVATSSWSVGSLLAEAVGGVASLVTMAGNWVIGVMLDVLVPLMTIGSFVTNDIVRTGWPLVQGVANMGFILILLFIAFSTTLEVVPTFSGFTARRVLPRLLIAAVLINFSLVIGGVIIDFSRILMAIIVNLLPPPGGAGIEGVATNILTSSKLLGGVSELSRAAASGVLGQNVYGAMAGEVIKAMFTWLLAGSLIVIIWGLFVRYVALILLLIISPLAYLAIALPNTAGLARRWWQNFLKYVMYGPVVLTMLLFMNKFGEAGGGLFNNVTVGTGAALLQSVLALGTTVAMLLIAARAGSFLGVAGSSMAANAVSKYGRQGIRGTGKAVYVGSGARRGLRNIRDYATTRSEPLRKTFGLGKYSKYDEKGQLRDGQTSFGSRAGVRGANKDIRAVQRVRGPRLNVDDPALAPLKLQSKAVRNALSGDQIKALVLAGSDKGASQTNRMQLRTLLGDADVVNRIKDTEKERIMKLDVNARVDYEQPDEVNLRADGVIRGNETYKDANRRNKAQNSFNLEMVKALNSAVAKLSNPDKK